MKKKLFGRILQQYREMFDLLDGFHFNSTLTQSIFGSHLPHNRGSVISITHGDIEDRRRIRDYKEDCLHLIFIGNRTIYKGYHLLEKALLELEEEGLTKWQLDAWGGGAKRAHDRIHFCGTFSHSQLGEVFARDALLVVPSVWNETFSLVVLEALSFGIPALVSPSVGAKDVVKEYDEWFAFDDPQDLKNKLRTLIQDSSRVKEFNQKICSQEWRYSLSQHALAIEEFYLSL